MIQVDVDNGRGGGRGLTAEVNLINMEAKGKKMGKRPKQNGINEGQRYRFKPIYVGNEPIFLTPLPAQNQNTGPYQCWRPLKKKRLVEKYFPVSQ